VAKKMILDVPDDLWEEFKSVTLRSEGSLNDVIVELIQKKVDKERRRMTGVGSVQFPKLKCLRCDYEWYPRTESLPLVCPKCKSPYWNRQKRKADV
jgi:predicted Zn-ribbon and HTH transcriptional regulator